MAADLVHPDDRPDPAARFRADLASYLRGLSGPELADLLDGLPDPVKVDLIAELAARRPASARLPDTWPAHPDTELLRQRPLREVVADRRAARATRHTGPPPPALAEWHADRQRQAEQHADRSGAGVVAERRVAEALRARAVDRDPAAGHRERGDPPAGPPDWQGEERDSEREGDFGDSWRAYRERADHIRQAYGWRVPEPPPRAEHWLPLGRDDDQEHDQPPDRSRRWRGEERDSDREDR